MDYWKDNEIRDKYFNMSTRQLKNPTQWHQGRIWVLGKILVPRRREIEVISSYHNSPAAGHWGISRTTSMVKRNYVFKSMRRNVTAYVRTCDICQRGNGDTHLPRRKMEHIGDTCEEVGIGVCGLHYVARDDVEELGRDGGGDSDGDGQGD